MEQSFERSYSSLTELFGFLDSFLDKHVVNDADAFAVRLALEEMFTNMVKYSTSNGDTISVRLDTEDGDLVVALEDFDAEPFDPTAHPAPDVRAALRERSPGGLGLHLVRNMVDSVNHRYVDRRNIVTLRKKLAQ